MSALGLQLLRSAAPGDWPPPDNRHRLYAGASGMGKSGTMLIDMRGTLDDPDRGAHVIDIENEHTPPAIEYIAARVPWRRVHILDASSHTRAFGLPLIDVAKRDPEDCNTAALRALGVLSQVVNFGADDFGPRMKKCIHLGIFSLARTGRPLAALPELFGSRTNIRATLADALPFSFMQDALSALNDLPPRQLVDYTDALISRMMPLFASPSFRRVFGQNADRNIDIASVVRNREVVLLPLGELEHQAAVVIGSAYYSILHHHALHQSLDAAVDTDIYIDEVSNFLTPDLARGFDRLRKRKHYLRVASQRFAQFQKPDDHADSVLSAVLTNCRSKIVMGGMAPDDAELMARLMFTGHLDLDTVYKPGSRRPVVVGQIKATLISRAQARHHVEQSGYASSDTRSTSRMQAESFASSSGWGTAISSGDATSAASLPDGTLVSPATPLSNSLSRNTARARNFSGASSQGYVAARQSGRSRAESISRGSADGVSQAFATHEAYISQFADLETETYSLDEKLHAAIGLLMNLQPRQALVKIDGNAPVFVPRTPELTPAFRSAAYRQIALAAFTEKLARSSYLRPIDDVDAEIEAAIAELDDTTVDDPDFTEPEPTRLRVVGRNRGT